LGDELRIEIIRFTEEIFGFEATIVTEPDPEFSQNYFVVHVAANGDVSDIVRRDDRWHRTLVDVAGPSAAMFQLSLDVK